MINSIKALINNHLTSQTCARVCDTCVLIVYCRRHATLVIHRQIQPTPETVNHETNNNNNNNNLPSFCWFPYAHVTTKLSLIKVALEAASIIFKAQMSEELFEKIEIVSVLTFELPYILDEIVRYIMFLIAKPEVACNCQSVPKELPINRTEVLEWIPAQVALTLPNQWGPEVRYFASKLIHRAESLPSFPITFAHYGLSYVTRLINPSKHEKPSKISDQEMLQSVQVNEEQILSLFKAFMEIVFPSFVMNRSSFVRFMQFHELERQNNRITAYFDAMSNDLKNYLTFEELLLGLVAMDKKTVLCESRIKLIFRFYDQDRDEILSTKEFIKLIHDLHPEMTQTDAENHAENVLKQIIFTLKINPSKPDMFVNFQIFFNTIKEQIFEGVSNLCRANYEVFQTVQWLFCMMESPDDQTVEQIKSLQSEESRNENQEIMIQLQENKDELVDEMIIGTHGRIEHKDNESSIIKLAYHYIDILNQSSPTKWDENMKDPQCISRVIEEIKQIFEKCKSLLMNEKNILEIKSDCLILGDIHGQLGHLLEIARSIWPLFPALEDKKLVFIGNYIDPEHSQSFYVLLYLMCLKIIAPNEIIILRGRSEIWDSSSNNALKQHLTTIFENTSGEIIYENLNQIMDHLPIGAIVHETIFCCSGGVPIMKSSKATILEFNTQFSKPESGLVKHDPNNQLWQLIWNVPLRWPLFQKHYEELMNDRRYENNKKDLTEQFTNGFVVNQTMNNSYYFSRAAIVGFLEASKLSQVIVTNPEGFAGFDQMFQNTLLTISTCSKDHFCSDCSDKKITSKILTTSSTLTSTLTLTQKSKESTTIFTTSIDTEKIPNTNNIRRDESCLHVEQNKRKHYFLQVSAENRLITLFVFEQDKFIKEQVNEIKCH